MHEFVANKNNWGQKMKTINRLLRSGFVLLLLGFGGSAMAQDPGTVTRVVYGSPQAAQGEFRKVDGASWIEQSYQGGVFNFRLNGVDAQAVHLYDASRDTHIVLDIVRQQIFYRQGSSQQVPLYNIVSVDTAAPPQQATSPGGAAPTYAVAPRPAAPSCNVHSGQSVVISLVDHTGVMHSSRDANGKIVAENTPNCGWYGCRVAMFGGGNELKLNHGSSAPYGYPETFSLVKEGARPGDCLRYGDQVRIVNNQGQQLYMDDRGPPRVLRQRQDNGSLFYLRVPVQNRSSASDGQPLGFPSQVVFALTPNPGSTDNCGWYGCRVLMDSNTIAIMNHGSGGLGGYPDRFFLYPPICGARGQLACTDVASDSCNAGLAPDPWSRLCDDISKVEARARAAENGGSSDPMTALGTFAFDLINDANKRNYIIDGRFGRDLLNGNVTAIDSQLGMTALVTGKLAGLAGTFHSISIGAGADGGLVAGVAGDMGVMIDISPNPNIRVYRSFSLQAGTIAGVGVSASIGISKNSVLDSPGEGNALSGGAGPIGLTMTFNSQTGEPDGASISAGVGVQPQKLALPVDVRASTSLTQLYTGGPPDSASSWYGGECGGNGERPCHFVEQVPSCDFGYKENFLQHRCIPASEPIRPLQSVATLPPTSPSPARDLLRNVQICGAEGQRPCTVVERIPSCDAGLKEDFLKGLCVK
ncbi:MAG: hypothetical protein OEX13_13045 [Gammaproteobacteria bacterium]|nr:hypothetical protein [Gammaproteobacteria bacterium]